MDSSVTGIIEQAAQWTGTNSWIVKAFIVVTVTLSIDLAQRLLLTRLLARLARNDNPWDDAVFQSITSPLSLLIWVLGLTLAANIAAENSDSAIFDIIEPIRTVGVIVSLTWFLIRLIKNMQQNIIDIGLAEDPRYDRTTAEAIGKLLRLSVVITSGLVLLQSLGFSISGVLAFGGVGGIAVGFAAKDLLANFFGGLMIYLDRPFAVGDWIKSPDREIEGIVEDIGWRLTCIRSFDKRPIYVPNSTFANISVVNPSRMSHRRIFENIGVRYDDAGRLEAIITDVKTMLQEHDEIDHSQILMVNFDKFADSALEFFIYTFTRTTDWKHYHAVKQDVLFRINRIITSHGAEIAFPTNTVHLADTLPEELRPTQG